MSLRLVQLGLTGAAMFSAEGKVLQPSEVLYKKPVLIERGRFRPVTYVNLDLAAAALERFEAESDDVARGETVSIMEITMRNLMHEGEVDLSDFISRAEVLATTGHTVMISDFAEYYRLAAYLFRYTNRRIGLAMGAMNLREIFDESSYAKLEGGILENFGRLFKNNLKLFVYPYIDQRTRELVTDRQARARPVVAAAVRLSRRAALHRAAHEHQPRVSEHLLARRAQQDQREEHGVGVDGAARGGAGDQVPPPIRLLVGHRGLPRAYAHRSSCRGARGRARAAQRRSARNTPITISTAPVTRAGVRATVSERSSP